MDYLRKAGLRLMLVVVYLSVVRLALWLKGTEPDVPEWLLWGTASWVLGLILIVDYVLFGRKN
jgi:uncharacterized protein YybS (DUF2232 family)